MSMHSLTAISQLNSDSIQDFKEVLQFLELGEAVGDIEFGDDQNLDTNCSLKSIHLKPPSNVYGPMPILVELCKKSPVKAKKVLGRSAGQRAMVHQWMEYNLTNLVNNPCPGPNCLRELDAALQTSTFFAGNTLTAADLMIYCALYRVFKDLNMKDKEKYTNLSRWFRLIQEYDKLRGPNRDKIVFTRKPLYSNNDSGPSSASPSVMVIPAA